MPAVPRSPLSLALPFLPLLLLLHPIPAQSETCPPIAGGSQALAGIEVEQRLGFLRARLARETERVESWSHGWKVAYGLLTGGQLALIPMLDSDMTPDLVVGAATSAIGFGSLLVLPLDVLTDGPAFEARLAGMRAPVDRCKLLADLEAVIVKDAANAAEGRGWLMHSLNALIAIASGLVLGLGFDRWQEAGLNAAASLAIGELMIWTQPSGLEDDLLRYRAGNLDPEAGAFRPGWFIGPVAFEGGGGVQCALSF